MKRGRFMRARGCPYCGLVRCGAEPGAPWVPCAGFEASLAARPVVKKEPLVCGICGRPGCWTDKAGCPGERTGT